MYCATCIYRQLSMPTCKIIRLLTFQSSGNDSYRSGLYCPFASRSVTQNQEISGEKVTTLFHHYINIIA